MGSSSLGSLGVRNINDQLSKYFPLFIYLFMLTKNLKKLFLDDFNVFSDLNTHLPKL